MCCGWGGVRGGVERCEDEGMNEGCAGWQKKGGK
jgi:hypothetical protein